MMLCVCAPILLMTLTFSGLQKPVFCYSSLNHHEDKSDYAYYKMHVHSNTVRAKSLFDFFKRSLSNEGQTHIALLNGHRVAVRIPLKFSFPFYGYPTRELMLATGGFLYLGELYHDHLTYSQYIAPLMADFDASINPGVSMVNYTSDRNFFIAQWNKIRLKNCFEIGDFSIAVGLFDNGTIFFAYKEVPQLYLLNGRLQGCRQGNYTIRMREKRNSQKDVLVGISDAYLFDVRGEDRKRIMEYTTMNLPLRIIRPGTVVILTPLPTCVEQTTCSDCLGDKTKGFQCQWCPQIQACSSGVDRGWQRWRDNDCHLNSIRSRCDIFVRNRTLILVITAQLVLILGLLLTLTIWFRGKSLRKRQYEWTNQALANVLEDEMQYHRC